MTNFALTNTTKVLAVTAVLAAILFTVGQADAGTQMPYWKKLQMQNQYNDMMNPGTPGNGDPIVVVDEETPQDNPSDGGQTGGGNWPGDMGNDNGNGGNPVAAPTPSAVLGGIAMLGLMAGRRNRKNQDD